MTNQVESNSEFIIFLLQYLTNIVVYVCFKDMHDLGSSLHTQNCTLLKTEYSNLPRKNVYYTPSTQYMMDAMYTDI